MGVQLDYDSLDLDCVKQDGVYQLVDGASKQEQFLYLISPKYIYDLYEVALTSRDYDKDRATMVGVVADRYYIPELTSFISGTRNKSHLEKLREEYQAKVRQQQDPTLQKQLKQLYTTAYELQVLLYDYIETSRLPVFRTHVNQAIAFRDEINVLLEGNMSSPESVAEMQSKLNKMLKVECARMERDHPNSQQYLPLLRQARANLPGVSSKRAIATKLFLLQMKAAYESDPNFTVTNLFDALMHNEDPNAGLDQFARQLQSSKVNLNETSSLMPALLAIEGTYEMLMNTPEADLLSMLTPDQLIMLEQTHQQQLLPNVSLSPAYTA